MSHMIARSALSRPSRGMWDRRSVFVRATPVPLSFAERRAVLHALKTHCRIDFFRKIKNNPASFLSMTESQEAAEALIAKSPLTYQLATDIPVQRAASATSNEATDSESPQTRKHPKPQEAGTGQPDGTKTSFVLHIFPTSDSKSHADLLEDYALFRWWPRWPDTEGFVAKNLTKSIPEGGMRDALADWETGGQLVEDGDVEEKSPSYGFHMRRKKREDKMGLSELLREP